MLWFGIYGQTNKKKTKVNNSSDCAGVIAPGYSKGYED